MKTKAESLNDFIKAGVLSMDEIAKHWRDDLADIMYPKNPFLLRTPSNSPNGLTSGAALQTLANVTPTPVTRVDVFEMNNPMHPFLKWVHLKTTQGILPIEYRSNWLSENWMPTMLDEHYLTQNGWEKTATFGCCNQPFILWTGSRWECEACGATHTTSEVANQNYYTPPRQYVPPAKPVCECGADKTYGPGNMMHSGTMPCPLYKKP